MKTKNSNKKGMTLIEVIVTLAISVIVIQVLYTMFFSGSRSFEFSKNRGFTQQDIRFATDFINSELRYIDKLDNKPLEKKYYSLQIKEDIVNNGNYFLEKREYSEENPIEGTLIKSVDASGLTSIEYNAEKRKIIATFNQSGYQPIFKLSLENEPNLIPNLIISKDDENKKMYYSFPNENSDIATVDPEDPKPEKPDPEPDPQPTPDPEPDPETNPGILKWQSGTSYELGDKVNHNGKVYEAVKNEKWNLSYKEPGSNDEVYRIWKEVSDFWVKHNIYYKDDVVLYNDKVYMAKHYISKIKPDQAHEAWEEVPKWNQDKKYIKDFKIWYKGSVYIAQNSGNGSNPHESPNKWKKISL